MVNKEVRFNIVQKSVRQTFVDVNFNQLIEKVFLLGNVRMGHNLMITSPAHCFTRLFIRTVAWTRTPSQRSSFLVGSVKWLEPNGFSDPQICLCLRSLGNNQKN